MNATLVRRLASLLWFVPALLFSLALMSARSHARAPSAWARPGTASSAEVPIDPSTARSVFDTLRSARRREGACAFDGVTTVATRIEARWRRADLVLPPALVTRQWIAARASDGLVVSVPPALREACPDAAAALDALGGDRTAGSVQQTGMLDPIEPSPRPIRLASARWLWMAIALALAAVTRWVVLELARAEER